LLFTDLPTTFVARFFDLPEFYEHFRDFPWKALFAMENFERKSITRVYNALKENKTARPASAFVRTNLIADQSFPRRALNFPCFQKFFVKIHLRIAMLATSAWP